MAGFYFSAIEGDFCERLGEIARACHGSPRGEVRLFDSWEPVAPFMEQPGYLTAALSGGWTILMEDAGITTGLFDHPEVGAALAVRFGTRVVSAFGSSVNGSCGYRIHGPSGSRGVMIEEHRLTEESGEPFPGETTTDLQDRDMYSVLDELAKLGIDPSDGVGQSKKCALVQLAPVSRRTPKSRETR